MRETVIAALAHDNNSRTVPGYRVYVCGYALEQLFGTLERAEEFAAHLRGQLNYSEKW